MKLSFCMNYLFSVGEDGNLIIHEVKDKDPKGRREKDGYGMDFSDEILTQESVLDEKETLKKGLLNEHQQLLNKDGMSDILNFKKREEELQKIQEDIQANNISDNTKYEALNSEKTNAYN